MRCHLIQRFSSDSSDAIAPPMSVRQADTADAVCSAIPRLTSGLSRTTPRRSRFSIARRDDVDRNAARAELLRHVARQHFDATPHRA